MSRSLASLVALYLVGCDVASPPSAAPRAVLRQALSAPTISSPAAGASSLASVYVTGTAEPGLAVAAFRDGSASPSCTTTSTPHGTFACALTSLSLGAHSLVVTVTDAANNVASSPALSFTVVAPTCTPSVAMGNVSTALTTALKDVGVGLMAVSPGGASLPDGGITLTANLGASINWASYTPPATTAALSVKGSTLTVSSTYLDMTASLPRTLSVDFGTTAAALSSATSDYQYLVAVSGQSQEGLAVTDTFSVPLTVLGTANTFNTNLYSLLDGQPSTTLGRTGTAVSSNPPLSVANGHTFFTLPKATRQFTVVLTGDNDPHGIIFGVLRLQGGCTPITVATPAAGATLATPTPAVAGTCEAGASVTVTEGASTVCTATCSAQGLFTCTPGTPLATGTHTLTARQRDLVGLESFPATRSFSVDTSTPAAPVLSTPAAGSLTSDATPTVAGTATPGATVSVFVDGGTTPVCIATVDAGGQWTCTPTAALSDGPHSITAQATNAAGTASPSTTHGFVVDTTAPLAPSLLAPVANATTSPFPTFSGTAEAGSTVRVVVDGGATPVCTALTSPSGDFACVGAAALADGPHEATATATDAAGNTSPPTAGRPFTVGAAVPLGPPIISVPAPASSTSDTTPTVGGTAPPASTVDVFIDGSLACSAVTDAVGAFSCDVSQALAEGTHTAVATASSASGTSGPSSPVAFTVDTMAPSAPTITSPEAGATTSARPGIVGTAEAGATITVFLDGSTSPFCTALADATGHWGCSSPGPLTAGPHGVAARATDAAGNQGPACPSVAFTVDAARVPDAPHVARPAAGSTTADTTPEFAGTAAPLSTVTVRVDDVVTCTGTADVTGAFACTAGAALAEGAHAVTATATDAAGTSAPSVAVPFSVDTTVPAAPVVTSPARDASTGPQPTITGTAEAGTTAVVRIDGLVVCAVLVDSQGQWTCPVPRPLPSGAHGVSAIARDGAGNASPPSDVVPFSVLGAPRTPVLEAPASGSSTTDTTPRFSGTAEPGSTVTVKVDAVAVCTAMADTTGHFECVPAAPLELGLHQAAVSSETAGGVASSVASPFTVVEAPTISAPTQGEVTLATPTFSGTAAPGSAVSVLVDDGEVCTTTAAADGTWSCTPSAPLTTGEHAAVAAAAGTDGAAHRSELVSFRVAVMSIVGAGLGCSAASGSPTWLALLLGLFLLAARSRAALVPLVLLMATTGRAQAPAQTPLPSFELERVHLHPAARGGLLVGSADLLEQLEYRVAVTGHYEHAPLVLTQDGTAVSTLVKSRVSAHVSGALGLTRWLEFGLQLPVVVLQTGHDASSFGLRAVSQAVVLGTPWVQLRAAPIQQRRGAPLDVAVGAMLGLPVGSAASLTSDSAFSVLPGLSLGRDLRRADGAGLLRVGGDLSALVRPSRTLTVGGATAAQVGNRFSVGLLLSTLGDGLRGELSGRLDVPLVSKGLSGELWAGVRYTLLELLELYAVGGPGFGSSPGTPTFRVMAGLALAPKVDRCADGAKAPVQACPQLDRDADGVPNGQDACPLEPGPAALRGCPDHDSDGDGVLDSKDACVSVAGVAELNGCPEPDRDGDGFVDAKDACPAEAQAGSARGCPDSDGDGLDDAEDKCPRVAGERALAGCPDTDSDEDGVVDRFDACRTEKGPPSNEGCPLKEKQLVVITRDKLVIREKVFFATGKSKVLPRSATLLSQVARVLKEHPEVEVVSIEGHTDSRGNQAANVTLSQARAEEVRQWLLGLGVDPGRLRARGFGPDRPVATNDTAAGREANRRVEFIIVGAETRKESGPEELDLTPLAP